MILRQVENHNLKISASLVGAPSFLGMVFRCQIRECAITRRSRRKNFGRKL